TVAHRKALDLIRTRRRQALPIADPPDRPSHGSDGFVDEELWARVRDLPDKQRTAVALRFVADAAYAEISAAMGTSEEAARRSVHEGLKRLRVYLDRDVRSERSRTERGKDAGGEAVAALRRTPEDTASRRSSAAPADGADDIDPGSEYSHERT